jgi:hypothetical protein
MRSYPNIDRSGFKRGEYVAYGPATTYRVRRAGEVWQAYHVAGAYAPSMTARTLGAISELVASGKLPKATVWRVRGES